MKEIKWKLTALIKEPYIIYEQGRICSWAKTEKEAEKICIEHNKWVTPQTIGEHYWYYEKRRKLRVVKETPEESPLTPLLDEKLKLWDKEIEAKRLKKRQNSIENIEYFENYRTSLGRRGKSISDVIRRR